MEQAASNRRTVPPSSEAPNTFALRIEGDSMRPRIRHGEFVVIEPNATYSPGDDVYVALKDGRKLVKTLGCQRDGMTMLLSANDSEAPILVSSDQIQCVHRVGGILPASGAFEPCGAGDEASWA